jgi:hypothetical protein
LRDPYWCCGQCRNTLAEHRRRSLIAILHSRSTSVSSPISWKNHGSFSDGGSTARSECAALASPPRGSDSYGALNECVLEDVAPASGANRAFRHHEAASGWQVRERRKYGIKAHISGRIAPLTGRNPCSGLVDRIYADRYYRSDRSFLHTDHPDGCNARKLCPEGCPECYLLLSGPSKIFRPRTEAKAFRSVPEPQGRGGHRLAHYTECPQTKMRRARCEPPTNPLRNRCGFRRTVGAAGTVVD